MADAAIYDLGLLDRRTNSTAVTNRRNQTIVTLLVASGTSQSRATHAFLWNAGRLTDLGTLGGATSIAYDLNDRGQVVGVADTAYGGRYAFVWSAETGMRQLDMLGLGAIPRAITNGGQIVGQKHPALRSGVNWVAFVLAGSRLAELDPLSGAISAAYDLNQAGQIVVTSR